MFVFSPVNTCFGDNSDAKLLAEMKEKVLRITEDMRRCKNFFLFHLYHKSYHRSVWIYFKK